MADQITEVTRAGNDDKANELLREGWRLYAVVPKSPQDQSGGVHWIFVK